MRTQNVLLIIGLLAAVFSFSACSGGGGGESGGSSGSGLPNGAVQGVVVDPYIVGARFFEDLNGNGVHDAFEHTLLPLYLF